MRGKDSRCVFRRFLHDVFSVPGEATPRWEHEIDWKRAVDQLRTRIRRATGSNLLRAVVLPALPPVGGYRLAPGVRVRRD